MDINYTRETDINKYRLTSLEEPTDEMLAQIMREATEQVRHENETARLNFWEAIRNEMQKV